jgi:endonuclease YncB( thermonuclease family)
VSGQPIRLSGLTCNESNTRLGDEARNALRGLTAGQRLACTLTGEQTYDRAVGRCRLVADGQDIGAILIARGLCARCSRYDPFREYAAVQARAGTFSGRSPGYCWAPW